MQSALIAAAACSAYLMGAAPVLPDRYISDVPGPDFCEVSGRPNCGAAFIVWANGSTTIVSPADDFALAVHETCHAIQHAEGRALDEPECEAVQARADECKEAL